MALRMLVEILKEEALSVRSPVPMVLVLVYGMPTCESCLMNDTICTT